MHSFKSMISKSTLNLILNSNDNIYKFIFRNYISNFNQSIIQSIRIIRWVYDKGSSF